MKKLILVATLILTGVLASIQPPTYFAAAQTTATTTTLREDFSNGSSPPRLNQFNFIHTFTLSTAWDLGGSTLGEPLSQSAPFALTLYAGNEDRVTFNLASIFSYVSTAQVWGWTMPARNGLEAGRGRIVFEGTGDNKTFTLSGGAMQWQLFEASETDIGDNGNLLGAIVAVRLADVGNNGVRVMFDDLELVTVTPPRRSNMTLTMVASANAVTVGQTITYDLTVINAGPESAPNVTITDDLPYGATFLAGGSSTACQLVRGQVVCEVGALAVSGSVTVTIAVQVGQDVCASLTNRATVTAQALDNNMADNTAVHTATTPLPACADFAITLTALPVPLDPGENLTYVFTIKNNGPDPAGGTATLTLPPDYSGRVLYGDSGVTCDGYISPISCTLAPLGAGLQKQIFLTANVSPNATGMQTTVASATSTLPDPLPENNNTRFRFAIGRPFDFTIIAELDTGALTGLDNIWSIDMNNQGEVAFMAIDLSTEPSGFLVYEGDGTVLRQKFAPSDLPPLSNGLVYRPGFVCPDISDAGAITMVMEMHDPTIDSVLSDSTRVGSILYLIEPDGSVTTLDTQQLAVNGPAYRAYDQAVIDSAGQVVVGYEIENNSQPDGLLRFNNGQSSLIYETSATDIRLDSLGSSPGGFAWQEIQGWLLPNHRLIFAQETNSGLFLSDRLLQPTRPFTSGMIGVTEYGATAYSQIESDPLSGTTIESFYLGGQQPILSGIAVSSSVIYGYSFNDSIVNEALRFAVRSRYSTISYFGDTGIYLGPDRVGHRVVRTGLQRGDFLFGSRIMVLLGQGGSCAMALNDAGQLAFGIALEDGRILIIRGEPTRDNDGDGISDWDELGAANHGDGNGDGIVDSVQPDVTSVPNGVDGQTITFTTDPNSTLTNAQAVPNPSPSDTPNASFSFGFFAFELSDLPADGRTSVTLTLPWAAVQSWWKYGRTPNNPTPHWYEFLYDGTTGAEINGNVVTLHFLDGARGDDDLTANGVIVDPGGPSAFPHALMLPLVTQ